MRTGIRHNKAITIAVKAFMSALVGGYRITDKSDIDGRAARQGWHGPEIGIVITKITQ